MLVINKNQPSLQIINSEINFINLKLSFEPLEAETRCIICIIYQHLFFVNLVGCKLRPHPWPVCHMSAILSCDNKDVSISALSNHTGNSISSPVVTIHMSITCLFIFLLSGIILIFISNNLNLELNFLEFEKVLHYKKLY